MKSYLPLLLRTRLKLAFLLLSLLTGLLFIAISSIGADALEIDFFQSNLRSVTQWLRGSLKEGIQPSVPEGFSFFDETTVPARYQNLEPGYHEIEISTFNESHMLVFDESDRRFFLMQDSGSYEDLEYRLNLFLWLALLSCIAMALWLGHFFTERVIAPIVGLATAIKNQDKNLPYQQAKDEIGVLAREFTFHSEQLREYLWRERCFTGDVSHELRTPLAVIQGAAEVIERRIESRTYDDPLLYEAVTRIHRVTEEMNEQLNALLLLARGGNNVNKPKTETAMMPIVRHALQRCSPILVGKPVNLNLEVHDDIDVAGEPELIFSLIHNVLRNACQYTDHGDITVTLTSSMLTIEDTGPGMPSNIGPDEFQRFQPGGSQHGEGLGLSIAQRIATHLGWTLKVTSSAEGSIFRICWQPL